MSILAKEIFIFSLFNLQQIISQKNLSVIQTLFKQKREGIAHYNSNLTKR